MKCPKCNAGRIRVLISLVCCCGHHQLFCDQCFSQFVVSCGSPLGVSKLPPEYPMTEKVIVVAAYAFRQILNNSPKKCPLLEDFKLSLAGKSS